MKLLSWNVNGIRSLAKTLGSLENFFKRYEADIICFQETRVSSYKNLVDSILHVPGYESFWSFCTRKQGYSGVVTYAKIGITSDAQSEFPKAEKFNDEGRVILTDHGSFVLLNVYCPNGGMVGRTDYKMEFCDWLKTVCVDISSQKGKSVIIVGDMNIGHTELDVDKPEPTKSGFLPIERTWFTTFLDSGFIDSFRYFYPTTKQFSWFSPKSNPTRIPDQGWRIDYAIVSSDFISQVNSSEILPTQWGSDHVPILLDLKSQILAANHPISKLSSRYQQKIQPKISSFFQKRVESSDINDATRKQKVDTLSQNKRGELKVRTVTAVQEPSNRKNKEQFKNKRAERTFEGVLQNNNKKPKT